MIECKTVGDLIGLAKTEPFPMRGSEADRSVNLLKSAEAVIAGLKAELYGRQQAKA